MSQADVLLQLVSDGEICRLETIVRAGVTAATVQRAVAAGVVERVSRGVYRRMGSVPIEAGGLAEASIRIPKGVICLISAAEVHGLGSAPQAVWMALPHNVKTPRVEWPAMEYVRFRSPRAFEVGVDERRISGVVVKITSPARTVVDMLHMASTVGRPIALACLRQYHRLGMSSRDVEAIADELGWSKRIKPILEVSSAMAVSMPQVKGR